MADRRVLFAATLLGILVVPAVAGANMGIPMIVIMYPAMGALLLPVIALETAVLRRRLGASPKRTAIMVTVSNLASTLVGVPVTWSALFLLQLLVDGSGAGFYLDGFLGKLIAVVWYAPWMVPSGADEGWMVPAAALVLLVPFFFASWMVEYAVSVMFMREVEPATMKRSVLVANLVSYALLAAVALAGVGLGISRIIGF